MLKKITTAFWTAWRWPEVYTNTKSILWASRTLVLGLPIALLTVTMLAGMSLYGLPAAIILTLALFVAMLIGLVRMFYCEHEIVEVYSEMDNRVKDYFLGFPEITALPIVERRNGEWISYGHVEKEEFLNAIYDIISSVTKHEDVVEMLTPDPETFEQTFGAFVNPDRDHWDEGIEVCRASKEACFPITRATAPIYKD